GEIKLYRDVSYLYPPLAPYLIAAIVAAVGSSLGTMTAIGILASLAIASLLYLLGRKIGGVVPAAIVAFLFVTIHVAGTSGYSFNFIFPYSHNAVFGFLFILLFLYALLRYAVYEEGQTWLWMALLSGSLASWSKIEFAAAFLILLAASFFVRKPRLSPLVVAGGLNALLLAALEWYFSDAPPVRHWLTENILPQSLLSGGVAREFYGRIQGLDDPGANLAISAGGALLIIAATGALAAIDRWQAKPNGRLFGTMSLVALLFLIQFVLAQHFLLFRGWFIIQILLVPWAVRARRSTPLFLLLLFSLLLGSRILLRLEPTWYGFLFSIPAEIVMAYVLFEELPRRGVYRPRVALLWLPLFVLLGLAAVTNQHQVYEERHDNPVSTKRGVFYDRLDDRAEIFNELFAYLDLREPESMIVVPEGLALNWLAEVPVSFPYHTFSPAEMPDAASQTRIIEELRANPPEIALLLRRDYGEFGFRGIGVDFGKELIGENECRYEPTTYRESERDYVVMMERKRERSCP
ncbi:MAG: hypothetical protein R3338_12625, partial [Thermoanaerobaculia bacterium]|nr:hypothetical protein [Thermoanaerobaculia bacterium]